MKVTCEYCGSQIDDTAAYCPNCSASNVHMLRSANGVPKTIEELIAFCKEEKVPLAQMRFFLNENYTSPRAYGIYKDEEGNFIVYKNKGNGERIVRYRGTDEAYAVNEIYQKLRTEMSQQREMQNKRAANTKPVQPAPSQTSYSNNDAYEQQRRQTMDYYQRYGSREMNRNRRSRNGTSLIIRMVIFLIVLFIIAGSNSCRGNLANLIIYGALTGDSYDYGYDYNYDYDYDYDDYDSGYDYDYDDYDSWDDDWDDDDWDYGGDWDSGYSDWDSDW